jgi:hypothetical protein
MRARVPLDVDLEDRIVYGLTPLRLAYAVLAGLGAMAVWSFETIPAAARGLLALVLLIAGALLAYGRRRGRPLDGWLIDVALFLWSTRRLSWRGQ